MDISDVHLDILDVEARKTNGTAGWLGWSVAYNRSSKNERKE
jgi:hypothetical protein